MWLGAFLFTLLNAPGMMLGSWLLGEILDVVFAADSGKLLRLVVAALGVVVYLTLVGIGMYGTKSCFIHKALEQYKQLAYQNISQKGIGAFSSEKTGRYLSVLTNDVASIENNYLNNGFLLLYYILSFVGAVAMMCFYSPLLTVVALVLCILPGVISVVMGKELSVREEAVSDGNERFVSTLKDLMSGFSVIKSFKAEKQTESLFAENNHHIEQLKQRRRWWEGLLVSAGQSGGDVLQFGVFILGAVLTMRGELTAGNVLIIVNLCNALSQPMEMIPALWGNRKAACTLIEKLAEITQEHREEQGESIPSVLKQGICLKQVSFAYTPDAFALKDLELCFEPGKTYALVGSTGCGKSTLLHLLMGDNKNYSGSVTVDGKELRNICTDSLYDLISLISQNVFIFDDTILHNITMFADFPEMKIEEVIARSGLTELWNEKGADYMCGENGVLLSGGERQRIAIARCLLRDTPVLLVDEATSALDKRTAFEITNALLNLKEFTRIVVTHQLEQSLLQQYDEIIVLRGGRVCEQGTFDALMERKGYFYSLYHVSENA